jgi:hypothetical protein
MATAERADAVRESASDAPRGRDAPRTGADASGAGAEPRKPPAPAATPRDGAVFGVVVRHTAEELVLRHADFPELVRASASRVVFW